ncbi:carboxypeptidase [Brachybacterium halotolerans subsp. kimchii]|uniref:S10 family peptidase n=1 Tax=Brachybacterium halotolerans TaxID=2795215 RepID=UPI001E5BE2FE|nr:carboxypeptidase [Brachybacterium halotolerans]UEJ81771.1 carboxypeptidase [Brachybacterium halotolerans subsp. kimchii]
MTESHSPSNTTATEAAAAGAAAGALGEGGGSAPKPEDRLETTAHLLELPDGSSLTYTATAGTHVLTEEPEGEAYARGTAYAELFAVSYVATGRGDQRPVVFAFNGGPGSSTVWLHLGLLGPRRVDSGDAGALTPPPFGLLDNHETILKDADLVVVDAMSTGYSRPAPGAKPDRHHGITADRDLVADFIMDWLTRNERWLSPVHLAGESYGTTRASAVAGRLVDRFNVAPAGIALLSPVLDFSTIVFAEDFPAGNDAPYLHYLPTYAAIAHAHGKHPGRSLLEVVDEAEAFAETEYPQLLAQGHRLDPEEKREAAEQIAALIGVGPDWVERADLRVEHMAYLAEVLREEGRIVGRIDGRFSAPAGNLNAGTMETDPSTDQLGPAYTAAINQYLTAELGFTSDVVYEIFSPKVHPWSFKEFENRSVEVASDLARVLRKVPSTRVFVAHGYHDAATPFHASEHVLAHLPIPTDDYRERIRIEYYEAGHMMYVHEPSRVALADHLGGFVRGE